MEELKLVENGIFPIRMEGHDECEGTGFDHAGNIQGEGKLVGVPSLFVRTSGCNLRCAWKLPNGKVSYCDTPYSSLDIREEEDLSVNSIFNTIKSNLGKLRHIVITGGEPMLQAGGLTELSRLLKKELKVHITIETNGTIFDEGLAPYIDLFSVSPKLRNAFAGWEKNREKNGRVKVHALQKTIDFCQNSESDFQLKFVVAKEDEALEIRSVLQSLDRLKKDDVLIMPAGRNKDELSQTERMALEMCIENGWRYSPRLHIDFFGDKSGV